MLIKEVILSEDTFADEISDTLKRILIKYTSDDVEEIPTEDVLSLLSKQGYVVSSDYLLTLLNTDEMQGFLSSADKETIIPNTELPADIDTSMEVPVDVGAMAGDQAMQDINTELPQ